MNTKPLSPEVKSNDQPASDPTNREMSVFQLDMVSFNDVIKPKSTSSNLQSFIDIPDFRK